MSDEQQAEIVSQIEARLIAEHGGGNVTIDGDLLAHEYTKFMSGVTPMEVGEEAPW